MVSLPLFEEVPDRPKLVGIARIAASAKGAEECRSSSLGMMPMIAVVLST